MTYPENAGEFDGFDRSAARGAAVGAGNGADRATASTGKTGQRTAPQLADDPELTEVIDHWATLPEAVRLAVLALVRTAK